ncbi:MAG TPA: isoaspartyl peptidase/L-asparaginase [Burkholderiaceae bacterium]|nr:isoaspartyl peptidase/L-asparaginase [Burkholderiaceae bacterium]
MNKPVLAIHGGAGAIARRDATPEVRTQYEQALKRVLEAGFAILAAGGAAVDAVTEAVRLLEECPLFNAGYGSVFTRDGRHELDASIMDGTTLRCGAVANVTTVRNPVLAARAIMEDGTHVFMAGSGADSFARERGLECVAADFFSTPQRREQLERIQRGGKDTMVLDHDGESSTLPLDEDNKFGTVGAVALDRQGRLAAATSTGGMTNKRPGRVGDTPVIGAGCYASNLTCAVSATGTGEAFVRAVAAYQVAARMEFGGSTLEEAAHQVVHASLLKVDGAGGLTAVDAQGHVAMPFNTAGMYRGYYVEGQAPFVAIHRAR